MKISIWTNGDPEAGVPGNVAEIDIPYVTTEDMNNDEYREHYRACLKEAFSEMFDAHAYVMFEDEQAQESEPKETKTGE